MVSKAEDGVEFVLQETRALLKARDVLCQRAGVLNEPCRGVAQIIVPLFVGLLLDRFEARHRRRQAADLARQTHRVAPRGAERRPRLAAALINDAILDAIEGRAEFGGLSRQPVDQRIRQQFEQMRSAR